MNARTTKNHPRDPSPRFRASTRAAALASGVIALSVLPGCSWWRSMTGQAGPDRVSQADAISATSRPATTQFSDVQVAPVPPNIAPSNRPVLEGVLPGTTPLVYLVESNGMLRVRNVNADEEIIRFEARAGQIVRVDLSGVYLANKPVIGANLAPGTYAIEIVAAVDGIRSVQQRSAPPGQ